jgi:biopolymer transport protein ExbD
VKLTRDEDRRREPRANMTPMIDVTFQILIFFMCTMHFRTLDQKLAARLPRDVGQRAESAQPLERIRVRVDVVREGTRVAPDGAPWSGAGPYAYGPDRVLRYAVGPDAYPSLGPARSRLAELFAAAPERGVTLDARAGTVYGDVVPLLDACALIGFDDVSFAGRR